MRVERISPAEPKYPNRSKALALKVGAVAAAAMLVGASTGCRWFKPATGGAPMIYETPEPTEEAELMGDVVIEVTPEPTEDPGLVGVILPDPGSGEGS
jgi:hypothetical protein